MNTFGYLKSMESLRLEEFLLVKLQPGYLEILSEINVFWHQYKNAHSFADFFYLQVITWEKNSQKQKLNPCINAYILIVYIYGIVYHNRLEIPFSISFISIISTLHQH